MDTTRFCNDLDNQLANRTPEELKNYIKWLLEHTSIDGRKEFIRQFSCSSREQNWRRSLALGAQSLSHETTREVPTSIVIISLSLRLCVISFIVQHPLWLLSVSVLFPSLPPNTIKSS